MATQKIQPLMIGVFVVLSCLLFVTAVIIFGGSRYFDKENIVIAYFEGSLKGLSVGAPVTYKGVSVGQVKKIQIHITKNDEKRQEVTIPVLIGLTARQSITVENSEGWSDSDVNDFIASMCKQGLKAKLKLSSLVTGKRYIDLAFYKDSPPVYHDTSGKYLEIPTLPSESQQFAKLVERINFEELYDKTLNTLTSLESLTGDLAHSLARDKTDKLVTDLSAATASLNSILTKIDRDIAPILTNIEEVTDNANQGLTAIDTKVTQLADKMIVTVDNFNTTLKEADQVFRQAGKTLAPSSPLYYRLTEAMRQLEKTAASVATLSDFLYRNPNALLLGVQPTEKDSNDH